MITNDNDHSNNEHWNLTMHMHGGILDDGFR